MKFTGKKYKDDLKALKYATPQSIINMVERNYLPQNIKELQVWINSTPVSLLRVMRRELTYLGAGHDSLGEREALLERRLFSSSDLFTIRDFLRLCSHRLLSPEEKRALSDMNIIKNNQMS